MDAPAWLTNEVAYVLLLFILFVVPKYLQKFRIPSALTALAFGAAAGMGLGILQHDRTVELLSTLGIVALFLFAGLDVDLQELRREAIVLSEHVVSRLIVLALSTWAIVAMFRFDWRPSLLVALALLTPSTGFILDSLSRWGLSDRERFWVRSKAIATELVALGLLFVALQSTSAQRLGLAALALVLMVAALPLVFRWFAATVAPHAPKSEFGFLMMVAVVCALVTRNLGVYYLVGAFVVGMAAQQFRRSMPAFATLGMLEAVEAFASLFVPFYFFHAGLTLSADYFRWPALLTGAAFILVALPLRLGAVAAHRRLRFGEGLADGLRVGVSMLPTTVFTLVLVGILRDTFAVPPFVLGGLVVYTVFNTVAPSLFFRSPAPEFADELRLHVDEGRPVRAAD
jgi:Kef-type K+ transport system membrane component KefB